MIFLGLVLVGIAVLWLRPEMRNGLPKLTSQVEIQRELLLPDMEMVEPKQLGIAGSGDSRKLRFSTTFVNVGQGALEVFGHHDDETKLTYAAQYVYEQGGPGEYRQIGEFVFHPEHDHWHVGNYVWYELWSVVEDQPGEKLRSTEKLSFCIWDEHTNNLNLPGASQARVYTWPCVSSRQGMSVGWGDTYLARVEGQEIDLAGLVDGEYYFKSGLNPDRKILESNYDNNENLIRIEIRGNTVSKK